MTVLDSIIQDVSASVDRALSLPQGPTVQSAVHAEGENAHLRTHLDAAMFLADTKLHLANRIMTAGDVHAWWLVDDVQDKLWRAS